MRPGEKDFLLGAQEICKENGSLLVIDEVQTGFGRTGKMFAFQHYGLEPDILCVAKSIAGGIPMGATLLNASLGTLPAAVHGSTFGGNPLACAASLAAIKYLEENELPQKAAELGDWFKTELEKLNLPVIREVRGLGLMVGIELRTKVTPYLKALMEEGVLALPAGLTVLRFLPPLVIEKKDLIVVLEKVKKVLSA